VHGETAAALRDDPRALEDGQEAGRRLSGGARELGDVGLGRADEHVALAATLLARSGCSRMSRRMSAPRIAMARTSSRVSTVAERRSSSNMASSPKMSPGPNCASVIVRPSGCSRIARACPADMT
jgi:hypothetical protein